MPRERSFFRRGKQVHLRELTDLVAVRSPGGTKLQGEGGLPSESDLEILQESTPSAPSSRLESRLIEAIAPDVSLSELRAFEDAGWSFLPHSPAASSSEGPSKAKVFVKSGGRLALGTNTLVLQFSRDLSSGEAEGLLAPFGCRLLEKLSFAPGLFRAEVVDQETRDVLDVCEELVRSGVCKSAEPELIEPMGHR